MTWKLLLTRRSSTSASSTNITLWMSTPTSSRWAGKPILGKATKDKRSAHHPSSTTNYWASVTQWAHGPCWPFCWAINIWGAQGRVQHAIYQSPETRKNTMVGLKQSLKAVKDIFKRRYTSPEYRILREYRTKNV